jgi:hypothetical protein
MKPSGALLMSAWVLAAAAPFLLLSLAGAAPRAKTPAPVRFEASASKQKQTLEITPQGRKAVSFKMAIEGSCQRTVTGIARLKGGDLEMDEDENGLMYPAQEYLHKAKDGCELFLRIKLKQADRAVIKQAEDCKATCSPTDVVMKKVP